MEDTSQADAPETHGRRAGAMLAEARLAAQLDLAELSARSRIPQRHLAAIEAGDYAKLPSRTYAVGFSRTYARLLGLDERAVTEQVRLDLEAGDSDGVPARPDRFEPGDPARIPSRRLAWLSLLAVVVMVVGAFSFYRTYFSPGLGPPPLIAPTVATAQRPAAVTAARPTPQASGPVVFTSLVDGTWVRFYDGAGKRLFEGQLAKGQTYTVPADAQRPQLWTGRPNALAITIGGRPVPKLGEQELTVRDVAVDAATLLARQSAPRPVTAETSAAPPA